MTYTYKGAQVGALKILTALVLSSFLVACGGGTSADESTAGTDTDLDNADFDTDYGLDGDSTTDAGGTDDGFVAGGGGIDSDGNGISDDNENAVCKGLGGMDEYSSNASWNDNCYMQADLNSGEGVVESPFYYSTYAQGIQRVLYCSGAAGVAASTGAFADGYFGPNTGEAVRVFQQAENDEVVARQAAGEVETRSILAVDGIVGPQTWARLQTKVEENAAYIVNEDNGGSNYDVFGVLIPTYATAAAVNCSAERNFMGLVSADLEISGWRLTDAPGGTGINTFSIDAP